MYAMKSACVSWSKAAKVLSSKLLNAQKSTVVTISTPAPNEKMRSQNT